MPVFDLTENPYKVTVKERSQSSVELLKIKREEALAKEELKIKREEEAEKEKEDLRTKEEKEAEKENRRHETVCWYYKDETGKDMSEEEYKEYITIFKKARKGYSIFDYIDGDKEGKDIKKEMETKQ